MSREGTLTGSFVADTFAWLAYFDGAPAYARLDEATLATPTLCLAEVKRKLIQRKADARQLNAFLDLIQKKSFIAELDTKHALRGAEIAEKENIPIVDALIYSYASETEPLLTGDPHFRGKKNVHFLEG